MAADIAQLEKAVEKTAEQRRLDRESQNNAAYFTAEKNPEYWFCCIFQSLEQKQAFLEAVGWARLNGGGDKYISGTVVAKALGVKLPPGPIWKPVPEPKKRWAALAMDPD